MKRTGLLSLAVIITGFATAQVDPALLRDPARDTTGSKLNMDAIYDRPFNKVGRLPVSLGGYMEGNYQYRVEDGISEGHQFQMRRLTLFVSSAISQRIKFLSEIEFEEGTKDINIEFASIDFEFSPLFNLRGGVIMNPIGAFNQNHDGPKWEFVDRPISATQMLPATFSNAGFGVFGKKYKGNWAFGYEAYLSNGLNERIVNNTENKTFLPATKEDPDRFEESFNGSMLFTGKLAVRHNRVGELGISYMGGAYNKFEDDGLVLDRKRSVRVYAIDFNTRLPFKTAITGEWAWVRVDLPADFTEQFGRKQEGGFVDIIQPVLTRRMFGFDNAVLNAGIRLEFVDWNKGKFSSTGENISEHIYSLVPSISWRPNAETVFRINYRYNWQSDLLGNPATKMAAFQMGIATYF